MNDDTKIYDPWFTTMNDGWRMIVTRRRLAEPMERYHKHQNEHSSTFDLEWFKNDSTLIYWHTHHGGDQTLKRNKSGILVLMPTGGSVTTLFYFYFYFEHLNFTWSYLIDLLISWSYRSYLDDLILAILSRWSTILCWSLDLIIRWWSKIHFFYFITYMHSTCLWLMSFIDDWHAFYTCCCATCFYHMFYMCLPWGQHMNISI